MVDLLHKICIVVLFSTYVSTDKPCEPRLFGLNKIVCVCNATYCDTVDSPAALPVGQFVQYTSSQAGLRFKQTVGKFEKIEKKEEEKNKGWFPLFKWADDRIVNMEINRSETHQTILGFGNAITDTAGLNVMALSNRTQDNLLRSCYSPEGIELSLIRVPIGGSDYSTHPYTYDEFPGDTHLEHYRLSTADYIYKIPLLQRAIAMSRKDMKLSGAAWSPPVWMKTSNKINGMGFLKAEYYQAWADYHIKFLNLYKQEGLKFWAVSTGNEPIQGLYPGSVINSLGWFPWDQFKWVRENLGPALRRSQHNQTKILALDDQRYELPWWFDSLKSDPEASSFIDGIAVHWYADTYIPPSVVDATHDNFPDKFIIQAEASTGLNMMQLGSHVDLGSWTRGEEYMRNIIEYSHHWAVGWMEWNMALNARGGPIWTKFTSVDASIIVNDVHDEFYKQPMFYALGHFSKFVPEGSVRIGITPHDTHGLESVAFQTPENATVIVLWNKLDYNVSFTITDPERGVMKLNVDEKSFHTITYW